MKITRTCERCGKEFRPRRRTQKFCCTDCRLKHYEEKAGKMQPKVIKCAVCGKEIVIAAASHSRQKYCRECAVLVKKEQYKKSQEKRKADGRYGKKPAISLSKLEARIEGVQRRQARLESNIKNAREQKLSYGEYKAKETANKYARIDVEAFMKSLEART